MAIVLNGTTGIVSANLADGAVTKAKIEAAAQFHAGTVAYFPMSAAPAGWLKANGATISRTTYADLFAALGTTYGAGDGSTTFKIPDFRGEFIRSWDDSRGIDTSRSLNSYQKGTIVAFNVPNSEAYGGTIGAGTNDSLTAGQAIVGADYAWDSYSGSVTHHVAPGVTNSGTWWTAEGWGAGITRPRNFALLACIKY